MHAWLHDLRRALARDGEAVLVTVARVDGSAPREAGAKMIVTRASASLTIGGGHLEWKALSIAREMLVVGRHGARPRRLERMPLGPSLGQCCGGVVMLAFERVDARDLDWLDTLDRRLRDGVAMGRSVRFDGSAPAVRLAASDSEAAAPTCTLTHDATDAPMLTEIFVPNPCPVVLFGAGHVGTALVRVLATLPCRLHWVDERDALLPSEDALPALLGACAASVTLEANDAPDEAVDRAPPGTSFVVMTHDHARDFALTERILRRDDFAFFGLIGSRSKRQQFAHRLEARGIAPEQIARMTCPVGIGGVTGKAPETIAVAIATQLLQVWEAGATLVRARHAVLAD